MGDHERWDGKWAGKPDRPGEPDSFLAAHVATLVPGRVLDLAAGDGRNSIYVARQEFDVTAVAVPQLDALQQKQVFELAGTPSFGRSS